MINGTFSSAVTLDYFILTWGQMDWQSRTRHSTVKHCNLLVPNRPGFGGLDFSTGWREFSFFWLLGCVLKPEWPDAHRWAAVAPPVCHSRSAGAGWRFDTWSSNHCFDCCGVATAAQSMCECLCISFWEFWIGCSVIRTKQPPPLC